MDDEPTSSPRLIRGDSIYVSWQTRKGLTYVPRESGQPIDEIADRILWQWLENTHPNIVDHIRKQNEEDKTFRKNLKHG